MQISKDDVIGYSELPFTDLNEGKFEGWRKIVVPSTASKKSPFPNFFKSKGPELMLKVDISVFATKIECDWTGSTVEEIVPIAQLDERPRNEAQLPSQAVAGIEEEFLDHL
jgi:hypothetical protein